MQIKNFDGVEKRPWDEEEHNIVPDSVREVEVPKKDDTLKAEDLWNLFKSIGENNSFSSASTISSGNVDARKITTIDPDWFSKSRFDINIDPSLAGRDVYILEKYRSLLYVHGSGLFCHGKKCDVNYENLISTCRVCGETYTEEEVRRAVENIKWQRQMNKVKEDMDKTMNSLNLNLMKMEDKIEKKGGAYTLPLWQYGLKDIEKKIWFGDTSA